MKTRMIGTSRGVDIRQQIENLLFGQVIEQVVGHRRDGRGLVQIDCRLGELNRFGWFERIG